MDSTQTGANSGVAPGATAQAHVANEKATADVKAAASGAQAVADAVRRVADAAVAEVSKTKASGQQASDFHSSGSAGGKFLLEGPVGVFGASGTVRLNGAQLHTREWSSQRIVGDLPAGTRSGEVTVHVDSETTRRSYLAL